ncbi:MAG: hypothetical protein ACQGTM_06070 [bacterium]
MNIIELTKSTFKITSISYSERIKVCQFSFSQKRDLFPSYIELCNYINLFNERDSAKISITSPDDAILLFSKLKPEKDYTDFFADLLPDDDMTVNIEVNKNIADCKLSVYSYSEFSKDFLSNDYQHLISIFNSLLENLNFLIFDVLDTDIFWCTKTMAFIHNENILFSPKVNRKERLDISKSVSYNYSNPCIELLPDDFFILTDYNGNIFRDVFNRLTTILSLSYISSISTINDNQIKCQINGQRNLPFHYECDSIKANGELYRIYDWIYTDGNPTDKSIIAHNIISLHCKFTEIIYTDEKTLSSIISNYQLYLKDNANKYLDAKDKVSEYICDIVAKVGNDATELLSDFKKNLIAIFGFMITVVLVNIVSDRPLSNIFTKDVTVIIELTLLGSLVHFLICLFETIYKFKKNKAAYEALKKNYSDVFSAEEIDQLFGKDGLYNKSKKSVKIGICIYSILWVVFVIIAVIIVEKISENPFILPMISEVFRK